MPKLSLDNRKLLFIPIALLIITGTAIALFYNNKIAEQNKEFNAKILSMNKEINSNIGQLGNSLRQDISSLNDNLTDQIGLIDNELRNFKKKNNEEINTLASLIDEIEKQSEIKLGELKDELKSIKVKSKDFTAIIDDVLQSVASVGTNKGLGSGAVIDARGFIVTNYHVVDGASIIRVLTYDNKVYDAALIGYNDVADIAVLKVDAELKSLEFGNSDNVQVGERVIALGNPAGLSFTVTEGIVSAVHREGPNSLKIYLQTDVPINPGNSGGPLVNADSMLIGLNNFKIGGFEGLGFAIESNTAKQVAGDIIGKYLKQVQQ